MRPVSEVAAAANARRHGRAYSRGDLLGAARDSAFEAGELTMKPFVGSPPVLKIMYSSEDNSAL
jgi:hypothetical protein